MVRGRAKGHKHLSVKTESGKLVADAFFGFGRHGLDGSPKRFEGGSLVIAQRCKVLVDGLGFGCLDWCRSGAAAGLFWFHLIALSLVVYSSDICGEHLASHKPLPGLTIVRRKGLAPHRAVFISRIPTKHNDNIFPLKSILAKKVSDAIFK